MEEEKKKAYSEVVEVLKLIEDEKRLEKIPFEVIELIKRNSDPEYKPTVSKEFPLEEQNLRNETYNILGWIASKYWNEDVGIESETQQEVEIIEQNENIENVQLEKEIEEIQDNLEKEENIIRNAAVYNDIEPECLEGGNLPVLVSEIKWYQRIKKQVIRLFKIIFKIKELGEEMN